MRETIHHLPGHNCGACGHGRCDELAEALDEGRAALDACPVLAQERYSGQRAWLQDMLARRAAGARTAPPASGGAGSDRQRPMGLIDGYEADFVLSPLEGEPSCREMLLPLTPPALGPGEVIRYRPLGCPITHFARILEPRDGLLTVHVVGPRHRLGDEGFRYTDVGLCMVIGFKGRVEGRMPSVGQTVRFAPAECMMQKVHSAVVVACEGRSVHLEGVDLKVWSPPERVVDGSR